MILHVTNNAIVNAFTESKKLQYSIDKCKKIHIGKQNNICPKLNPIQLGTLNTPNQLGEG